MMANPKPDLQGWAEQPSTPGWQQLAISRVRARQHAKRRHNERKSGLYLFFDDPFRVYLDEACLRRNISLTGYMRRAGAAMIAHDLGLDIEEVMQHSARPAEYGATGGGRLKRTEDDGKGFGLWRILGLGK